LLIESVAKSFGTILSSLCGRLIELDITKNNESDILPLLRFTYEKFMRKDFIGKLAKVNYLKWLIVAIMKFTCKVEFRRIIEQIESTQIVQMNMTQLQTYHTTLSLVYHLIAYLIET
jgi:hypothetical protein